MALTPFRRKQSGILRAFFVAVLRLLGIAAGSPMTPQQRVALAEALTELTNVARRAAADNAWEEYLAERPEDLPDLDRPNINDLPVSYTEKVLDEYVEDLESPTNYVGATGRIVQSQARMVENAARDQTIAATRVDPEAVGWARVAVGETCGWCLMLVSRGAVYQTAETAGQGAEWHLNCNCAVVPKFKGQRYEGQDHAEALAELWDDATEGKRGKEAIKAFSEAVKNGDADHAKDARRPVGAKNTDDTAADKAPRRAQLDAQITTLEQTIADLAERNTNPEALAWQRAQLKRLRAERKSL